MRWLCVPTYTVYQLLRRLRTPIAGGDRIQIHRRADRSVLRLVQRFSDSIIRAERVHAVGLVALHLYPLPLLAKTSIVRVLTASRLKIKNRFTEITCSIFSDPLLCHQRIVLNV